MVYRNIFFLASFLFLFSCSSTKNLYTVEDEHYTVFLPEGKALGYFPGPLGDNGKGELVVAIVSTNYFWKNHKKPVRIKESDGVRAVMKNIKFLKKYYGLKHLGFGGYAYFLEGDHRPAKVLSVDYAYIVGSPDEIHASIAKGLEAREKTKVIVVEKGDHTIWIFVPIFDHPEAKPDEVYVTHVQYFKYWVPDNETGEYHLIARMPDNPDELVVKERLEKLGFKTARVGKVAYRNDGTAIKGCLPVFISKTEFKDLKKI